MNVSGASHYFLDAPTPEADKAAKRENGLWPVALALNQGRTVEELVDLMFEALQPLVPCDRIGIATVNEAGGLALKYVHSRLPARWIAGNTSVLTQASLEPILYGRKTHIIDDLEFYVREHPEALTATALFADGMCSSVALPVSASNKIVGVVFFSATTPRAYGPEQVDLLRCLAAGIGISLERAELFDSLQRAHQALATLDALKTGFIGNLSHELRTPLTTVLGSGYMLQDGSLGPLDPAQVQAVDAVVAGAERLNALLDDLFDFTLLESGHLGFEPSPCELGALVREVLIGLRPAIEQRGLTLVTEAAAEPVVLDGNAPLLARAVRALLDNACKFTPAPGEIRVTVGHDAHESWVEVQDTGVGIEYGDHGHIFEKFFQVDASSTRAVGGAGLGLALVRAIVLAHKGTVWFESKPQQGSRFRLSFPCPAGQCH